jgi:small ligand-binding sensory domain FIST
MDTCKQGLADVLAMDERNAVLLLPCVTRGVMLVPDQEGEARLIRDTLGEKGIPFAMGYSGGEVSPMPDAQGKLHNRFHNYTFCACIL